jgi:hypothetical protein
MKIIETKAPIFIFKMPDMKEEILKVVGSMEINPIDDGEQKISNGDWYSGRKISRPYFDIIEPSIQNCIIEVSKKIKSNPIEIVNFWYQQYGHNDWHDWHHHGNCTFASVYYVELPEKTSTTFDYMGEEFQVDVEEGDYLVFPSYLRHCSKLNKTGKRKTIIAINLNIK